MSSSDSFELRKEDLIQLFSDTNETSNFSILVHSLLPYLQAPNIELKRICYQFIINWYSYNDCILERTQELILNDLKHENSQIRLLAVRYLPYIQSKVVSSTLIDCLMHKLLEDVDPKVRKGSILAMCKIYRTNSELIDFSLMIEKLKSLLNDEEAEVVAAVMMAFQLITHRSSDFALKLDSRIATKVVAILPICNEWSQSYLVQSLLTYKPTSPEDAALIADKLFLRMRCSNACLTLSIAKVLLNMFECTSNSSNLMELVHHMTAWLVSNITCKSESAQYIFFKVIEILTKKLGKFFERYTPIFYCKSVDDVSIQILKIKILPRLATDSSVFEIFDVVTEYTLSSCDDVRAASFKALGLLLARTASITYHGLGFLSNYKNMVKNDLFYVKNLIFAISEVLPQSNQYQQGKYYQVFTDHFDAFYEVATLPLALHIISKYGQLDPEKSIKFLEYLSQHLSQLNIKIVPCLISATATLFLKEPKLVTELLTELLNKAGQEIDDPEIRETVFYYWRLLSLGSKTAKEVLLRPLVQNDDEPQITNENIREAIAQLHDLVVDADKHAFYPAKTLVSY